MTEEIRAVADQSRVTYENRILRLVTTSGAELAAFDTARDFAWGPDSSQIAFVTGDYLGHDLDFRETGVWIYDLASKTKRKVSEQGSYVAWAAFDGNLYIWDAVPVETTQVLRYNISRGKIESTDLASIYFSSTGDYYYNPEGFGRPADIYLTTTNLGMIKTSRFFTRLDGYRFLDWAPSGNSLLMEVSFREQDDRRAATVIYDPETDSGTEVSGEGVIGWGSEANEVLIAVDDLLKLTKIARPSPR